MALVSGYCSSKTLFSLIVYPQQYVQVRPNETADLNDLETYDIGLCNNIANTYYYYRFIEALIGQTVPSTISSVPVFSFKTTEENVQKIKARFGDHIIVDAENV
ncbi:hypothetical protein V8C37DRAFT_398193 [Trichoderma ceciliae]